MKKKKFNLSKLENTRTIKVTKDENKVFDEFYAESKKLDKKILSYKKRVNLNWRLLKNKYFLSEQFVWIYNQSTKTIEKLGVNPNPSQTQK
mgnify:CR=1 FL=1